MVLGQVTSINRYDVSLALPNNLTGFIPLTAISNQATQAIESAMEDGDQSDGAAMVDPNPALYFCVGQYLRAKVVSTRKEGKAGQPAKKHIELSVHPAEVNRDESTAVVVSSTVQGSVLSVEDHGVVMDLGFKEDSSRGFLPLDELPENLVAADICEGAVFLCLVTGSAANGKTVKLSANPDRIGKMQHNTYITNAPTIDVLLPGTAVEFFVSTVTAIGIHGKAMGLIDVTADLIHSKAATSKKSLETVYVPKQKAKGRIVCTYLAAEGQKVAVSLLDHVIKFQATTITNPKVGVPQEPLEALPLSTVVERVKIMKVVPGIGLFVDVGGEAILGFVHISRISDDKVDALTETTGKHKLGSVHRGRIIGYNPMDGLYIVSLEKSVIEQPFLRIEDITVGQLVNGSIEKLIVGETGVTGILVKLAEGITALIPEIHLADTKLMHPEQRFKEDQRVKCRVLSIDLSKRQVRLTMKKTLVISDERPWTSYDSLAPGLRSPGTIINLLSSGAVVQFYGSVRAFLPTSEMSESFIEDPREHFRVGQLLPKLRIISVEPSAGKMLVSCKDFQDGEVDGADAFSSLALGDIVEGSVLEKSDNEIIVELVRKSLKGLLSIEHLVDGSAQKAVSAAKRIRIGQILKDLVVLDKRNQKRLVRLSSKPSLVNAAKENRLPRSFEDVVEGAKVDGFVSNFSDAGAFIRFAGSLTGLFPKSKMPTDWISQPQFGLRRDQSISVVVLSVDYIQHRFVLVTESAAKDKAQSSEIRIESGEQPLSNPADGVSKSLNDYCLDKLTKAKVTSVKDTQINVQLADSIQGRIDASEVFDNYEDIQDRLKPLKSFRKYQILPVRIVGIHDTRNHRFLPISHVGKAPVFELTAKPSNQTSKKTDILTLDKVHIDDSYAVFVNNVASDHLWVNLSPSVRGRIAAIDVADDVSRMNNLEKYYPIGSALQARVTAVDVEKGHLGMTAKSFTSPTINSFSDLSPGLVLPAKVTKTTERQLMVQLSESVSAPVHLVDLSDDYSTANPLNYHKNQIVRVCVKAVDVPNKRLTLSTRPSRVLSSELPVLDPDLASISQVKLDCVYRGFVKNVADNGLFVSLASNVTAFIRISDLSDDYLKDWKADFEIDQLVKGKVMELNTDLNHVRMSLKASHLDPNYKQPTTFEDLIVGQTITGKVRKVQDYGVFVVIDDSANLSGLCHRSELSDQRGANPMKLYNEGDKVQAKILKIDQDTRRISFGLKAAYFKDENEEDEDSDLMDGVDLSEGSRSDDGSEANGVQLESREDNDEDMEMQDPDSGSDISSPEDEEDEEDDAASTTLGLQVGGFDWSGGIMNAETQDPPSDAESQILQPSKKRKRKADIHIDKTGDMDAQGPQSSADFERRLLGSPNGSQLWIDYMAFHLGLGEVDKARQIGERALRTINIREQTKKKFLWTAMLNLEMEYGDDESLDAFFERACQYNDNLEMHEVLASIYIQSTKYDKADTLFQKTIKKHSQSPDIYPNYATFLMDQKNDPSRARALLPKAMQALPSHTHISLTSKFAKLEFTSPHGEAERGRTMFEGLISTFPKKLDLRHVLLDVEMAQGSQNKERVRSLFERTTNGSEVQLKKSRQVHAFFNKWLAFDEKEGDSQSQNRVKRAQEKALDGVKQRKREAAETASC